MSVGWEVMFTVLGLGKSFTEPVLWTVDFHGCVLVPLSPELAGVGYSLHQGESGTDEAPSGQASLTAQCSGVFQKVPFPLPLPKVQGEFSPLFTVQT